MLNVKTDKNFFNEITKYIKKQQIDNFYDNKKINLINIEKIMFEKSLSPIIIELLKSLPKEKVSTLLEVIVKREVILKNKVIDYFKNPELDEVFITSSGKRVKQYIEMLQNFFDDSLIKENDEYIINIKNVEILYDAHLLFYYNYNLFKYNLHLASNNIEDAIKCLRTIDTINSTLKENISLEEQASRILSRFELLLNNLKSHN